MKTKGILTKIGVSENAEFPDSHKGEGIRRGYFLSKPIVGESFTFWHENDTKGLKTSFLTEILDETTNRIKFKTNNSIYQLDIEKVVEEEK